MKLDGHIHIFDGPVNGEEFLKRLKVIGFDGGLIISKPPVPCPECRKLESASERLNNLFEWSVISENLFPFFWIDPTCDDAVEQVDLAVKRGVKGFKVICNNFYPSDDKPMKVFRAIAMKQKPILFHSGILWDGKPSSRYNKPAEFEALIDIDNLKFCLAHISWPWCDELIAVYGKFQNAYTICPDVSCEMFIDLTPGTPAIYRQEVLTKLISVGYDVENNLIFGSDTCVNNYKTNWVSQWINRDSNIYKKNGLSEASINKIFGKNLERFVGISSVEFQKKPLIMDE